MTRTTIRRVSTFGVSGLTCPDCLVLLMERVRQQPGVREVTVDLEPAGESSLTIAPAEAVSAEDIRALVDEIGFDYIARRSHRRLDRSRFGGGWGIFRGFLNLGGTDDGIDTEGIHRGVQSLGGRVRDQ